MTISKIAYAITRLESPQGSPRSEVILVVPITGEHIEALHNLLNASKTYTPIRCNDIEVASQRNPNTAKTITGINVLANAGDSTTTTQGYWRITAGRARLHIRIENENHRSEPFSLLEIQVAQGRYAQIIQNRERQERLIQRKNKGKNSDTTSDAQ